MEVPQPLPDSQNGLQIPDIDDGLENPQLRTCYGTDVHDNMRTAERITRPDPQYMLKQTELNPCMRKKLIGWLIEIHDTYNFQTSTLYLAVSFVDSFLTKKNILTKDLQLLGITCLLIASKLEETIPLKVQTLCSLTKDTYTVAQVVETEARVVESCCYELCAPNADYFIRRYLRAAHASYETPTMDLDFVAKFLADLAIREYGFLKYLPSIIAASSIFLARWTLHQSSHPWNRTLVQYSKYKASDLKEVVIKLQKLQKSTEANIFANERVDYKAYRDLVVTSITIPDIVFQD